MSTTSPVAAEHYNPVAAFVALLVGPPVALAFGSAVFELMLRRPVFTYGVLVGTAAGVLLALGWLLFHTRHPATAHIDPSPAEFTSSAPVVVKDYQIVPVYTASHLIEGVPADDLAEFVERMRVIGWSQATWRGKRLRSGRIVDNDYWAQLVTPIERAGILVDRGPRRRGRLTTESIYQIKSALGILRID